MNIRLLSSLCVGYLSLSTSALPLYAEAAEVDNNIQAENKPQLSSLYRNSHILVHRGKHTIIPKGSIIYLPTKDKTKVCETPSGKFDFWPDFLKKNQSWIWTYEVTRDQAKGLKPIQESKLEEFAKMNRMVVATYQKSPITILPPPAKPEDSSEKQPTGN